MITQARLKELLDYDPDTGLFTWRIGRPGCSKGSVGGFLNKGTGYLYIRVDRKVYFNTDWLGST